MKTERFVKGFMIAILVFGTLWFGIKPLLLGSSYKNYTKIDRKDLNFEENEYATIVIGSEPEGLASALSCARTGLKTLLITKDPDLGSYITRSMISKMDPQQGVIEKKKVLLNGGIYQEIFGKFNIGFSGDDYQLSVKKLLEKEKSLDILYNSTVIEAQLEGQTLKGIVVQRSDGESYYKGHQFIDASQEGDLLMLLNTPHFIGSADLGMPETYAPLEFNFRISGVDVEALKKSQKTSDFSLFQQAIMVYKKANPRTKIVSPSFIVQNKNELVITGLMVVNVDLQNDEDVKAAFKEAEEEALLLTAYLKNVLVAFKDCTYKESPQNFYMPEYRHFEGRYTLKVSDILENKDFKDKIALCSAAVDAGKFVSLNLEYIVTKPNVYAIPLGSIIPSNLDNVLMTGSKASFTSLASTSAGSLPTRMTVGESAGLVSAYSFINQTTPGQLVDGGEKEIKALVNYIRRGGVILEDFSESLMIPKTEQKLTDYWAYPYIRTLAEYGIIAGNVDNDFKLDFRASQELFTVMLRNAILKITPEAFKMEMDIKIKGFEQKRELTGEMASVIILEALSRPYEQGKALETLKIDKVLPEDLLSRLRADEPVTLDVVFGLAIETVNALKAK